VNPVTQGFALATALVALGVIVWMLGASLLTLIVAIFPVTLSWTANLLGFSVAANFVYFISIAVLVLVCVQHSSELTKIESQVRRLAEEVALLKIENGGTPELASDGSRDP
jgi:hypothetical protein